MPGKPGALRWWGGYIPVVLGALLATALSVAIHWPLPTDLSSTYIEAAFNGDHVWAFDHIARMLASEEPLSTTTDGIGYPDLRDARLILWGPAILAMPLRPLLGPLGAFNVVVLLSFVFSFLAAYALARRLTGVNGWVCAAVALTYAFCPYALGSLASGQVAKVQLWISPLALLCIHGVLTGPRRGRWALALASSMFVGVFTSPSTMAYLPFAAVGLVLWHVWQHRRAPAKPFLWGGLAAGICAASLLPSVFYYQSPPVAHAAPAFLPATPPPDDQLIIPSPLALPMQTLLGIGMWDAKPGVPGGLVGGPDPRGKRRIYHLTYVGFPLLLLCLVLALRPFEGRGAAWWVIIAGFVLAAGPFVTFDNDYVFRNGRRLILPAWLLEYVGYPTSMSGQYYRAIHLVSLGLALGLAGGLGRLSRWGGIFIAWLMVGIMVVDFHRATGPLWPLKVDTVIGRDALTAMAKDPADGAVLELPIHIMDFQSQELMLAAVFHRRRSTALPQDRNPHEDPSVVRLVGRVADALNENSLKARHQALERLGYRYVILREHITPVFQYTELSPEGALGAPQVEGRLKYWRVDSAGVE